MSDKEDNNGNTNSNDIYYQSCFNNGTNKNNGNNEDNKPPLSLFCIVSSVNHDEICMLV